MPLETLLDDSHVKPVNGYIYHGFDERFRLARGWLFQNPADIVD